MLFRETAVFLKGEGEGRRENSMHLDFLGLGGGSCYSASSGKYGCGYYYYYCQGRLYVIERPPAVLFRASPSQSLF